MNASDSAYWSRQVRMQRCPGEHADGLPRRPEAAIGPRPARPEAAVGDRPRPGLAGDGGGWARIRGARSLTA